MGTLGTAPHAATRACRAPLGPSDPTASRYPTQRWFSNRVGRSMTAERTRTRIGEPKRLPDLIVLAGIEPVDVGVPSGTSPRPPGPAVAGWYSPGGPAAASAASHLRSPATFTVQLDHLLSSVPNSQSHASTNSFAVTRSLRSLRSSELTAPASRPARLHVPAEQQTGRRLRWRRGPRGPRRQRPRSGTTCRAWRGCWTRGPRRSWARCRAGPRARRWSALRRAGPRPRSRAP